MPIHVAVIVRTSKPFKINSYLKLTMKFSFKKCIHTYDSYVYVAISAVYNVNVSILVIMITMFMYTVMHSHWQITVHRKNLMRNMR